MITNSYSAFHLRRPILRWSKRKEKPPRFASFSDVGWPWWHVTCHVKATGLRQIRSKRKKIPSRCHRHWRRKSQLGAIGVLLSSVQEVMAATPRRLLNLSLTQPPCLRSTLISTLPATLRCFARLAWVNFVAVMSPSLLLIRVFYC